MWTRLVVESQPARGLFPNQIEIVEQLQVQGFFSAGPIESLDESVLMWLSELNILDLHSVFIRPVGELGIHELRAGRLPYVQAVCAWVRVPSRRL